MSSHELAQAPLLVFPECMLAHLADRELCTLQRNVLPEATLKEFRKTAELVQQEPWSLTRAAAYLTDLCNNGQESSPPQLRLVSQPNLLATRAAIVLPPPPDWVDFATRPVRTVSVSISGAPKRPPPKAGQQPGSGPPKAKSKAKPKGEAKQPAEAKGAVVVQAAPVTAKPPPKAKQEAAGKAKAAVNAMAKAEPPPKAQAVAPLPILGCSKCRFRATGCARCKARAAFG